MNKSEFYRLWMTKDYTRQAIIATACFFGLGLIFLLLRDQPLGNNTFAERKQRLATMLVFQDNPQQFKGTQVKGCVAYGGHDMLRDQLNGKSGDLITLPFLAWTGDHTFKIHLSCPNDLDVPNAGSTELLIVDFFCRDGSYDSGNLVSRIGR